jgi:hypothetical protein
MRSSNLLSLATAALLALTAGGQPASAADAPNTLTDAEKAAGWQLLFDGATLNGWHNFHQSTIGPGWQVKNGILICADPRSAGDIVTSNQYSWFELQLDYNITSNGNSGVLYHITGEDHPTWPTWITGPEFQLLDNIYPEDPQLSGWLYGLYRPPIDPKTGKPLDATKPFGQWNHIRLLVTPDKCEHDMNGVKYFEYSLYSAEFKARVAASKFDQYPFFAKAETGGIALQGDHGAVSFRNIKIRVIPEK